MTHPLITREAERLRTHAPELRDPTKCREFYAALQRGAREYGFTPQEIESIHDHRVMLVFRDALIHLKLWSE